MEPVRNYKDLVTWQKSMELTEKVYLATRTFPKEEIYGLTSQVRRAVVSIPSNIAEGQARKSTPEFLRFLSIACGSRAEVETQIIIAKRLQYIDEVAADEILDLSSEVSSLLNGLINSLKKIVGNGE